MIVVQVQSLCTEEARVQPRPSLLSQDATSYSESESEAGSVGPLPEYGSQNDEQYPDPETDADAGESIQDDNDENLLHDGHQPAEKEWSILLQMHREYPQKSVDECLHAIRANDGIVRRIRRHFDRGDSAAKPSTQSSSMTDRSTLQASATTTHETALDLSDLRLDTHVYMPEEVPYSLQVILFDKDDHEYGKDGVYKRAAAFIDLHQVHSRSSMTGEDTSIDSIESRVVHVIASAKPQWLVSSNEQTGPRVIHDVRYQVYLQEGQDYDRLHDGDHETCGDQLGMWMATAKARALGWASAYNFIPCFENYYKNVYRWEDLRFYVYLDSQSTEFGVAKAKHLKSHKRG